MTRTICSSYSGGTSAGNSQLYLLMISTAEAKQHIKVYQQLQRNCMNQQNIGQVNTETEETNAVTEARNKNDSVWIEIWHIHTTWNADQVLKHTEHTFKVKISCYTKCNLQMKKTIYMLPSTITQHQQYIAHIHTYIMPQSTDEQCLSALKAVVI